MRITYSYQGKDSIFDCEVTQVVIGRPKVGVAVDLDLTPDEKVSRPHARIWIEFGQYWIEDLNSTRGTQVNGEEIKGRGRQRLQSGDTVSIGETTVRMEIQPETEDSVRTLPPDEPESELVEGITQSLDASKPAYPRAGAISDADRRLTLLYELALRFGEEGHPDALLQLIVERSVEVIPGAVRGALLIRDTQNGQLLRAASLPVDNPAVSMTLAGKAIERCEGFVWSRRSPECVNDGEETDRIPGSAFELNIESAIYAPLLWKDEVLGVVCVDNNETSSAFSGDDLQLLQALAHHGATALAHLEVEKALKHKNRILANFLRLVSPQLAERLTDYQGQIRLGGEFRDATILFSDIRGFTKLSSQMEAEDVSLMIEDYFSRLVPVIFKHQGMVDKFVGDAILAVFGSPTADEQQHTHAVEAALEMQSAMSEVSAARKAKGLLTGELGIGIHCGEVVHGFTGSQERMEFTVIGDAVNRGSRYCDGAAGGEVLISPDLYKRIWNLFEVKETSIPTKHEGYLSAYRVLGKKR
jgi:adenylate cyclase